MVKHLVKYFLTKAAPRGRKHSNHEKHGNESAPNAIRKHSSAHRLVPHKDRFPWANERRVLRRKNFTLTIYDDNSRLYQFKDGGYLILTPSGVSIIKSQPGVIRSYLRGEKLFLVSGGNSNVYTFTANRYPLIVKEHFAGHSAVSQMEHARTIKEALAKERIHHSFPEYYAVASMPGKYVREISVMDLMSGKKISDIMRELKSNPTIDNMRRLNRLMNDYKALKKLLIKRKLPITDFHEGNVLATYVEGLGRYTFSIIDQ